MIAALLLAAAATWPTIPDVRLRALVPRKGRGGLEDSDRRRDALDPGRRRASGVGADAVYAAVTDYARLSPVLRPGGLEGRRPRVLGPRAPASISSGRTRSRFAAATRSSRTAASAFEAGGYRLTWRDDARASDPSEGVRIGRVAGETRIEPLAEGRCRVTYTFLGDLGGDFPEPSKRKPGGTSRSVTSTRSGAVWACRSRRSERLLLL